LSVAVPSVVAEAVRVGEVAHEGLVVTGRIVGSTQADADPSVSNSMFLENAIR
jgi:hypothetical protein